MRGLLLTAGLLATGTGIAQDDALKLTGYWKPVSVQYDGAEKLGPKDKEMLTLVIKNGEYRMFVCSNPEKDLHYRLATADLTTDPAKKTFELSLKDGQGKGEKRHGIYEISGSQLRLCYGPADKPRPTTFAAPKDSGLFCETWEREKGK